MKTFAMISILVVSIGISVCPPALNAEDSAIDLAQSKKATLELFQTMDMENIYNTSFEQTLRTSMKQNPIMAAKSEQIVTFYKKNLGWGAMRDDIAASYAERFTAAEIKEIEAFYKTDVGKKLAAAQTGLTAHAQKISQEKSARIMPELMKIIQE